MFFMPENGNMGASTLSLESVDSKPHQTARHHQEAGDIVALSQSSQQRNYYKLAPRV